MSADTAVPRILVVEDNVVNQRVVVRTLERPGYRVDVVVNGVEAVAVAGQRRYAAIFMDCQMPEMDGYEATRMIRSRELLAGETGGRRQTIIALTVDAPAADRDRCLAAGMDEYLPKPLRADLLVSTLERCVEPADLSRLAG